MKTSKLLIIIAIFVIGIVFIVRYISLSVDTTVYQPREEPVKITQEEDPVKITPEVWSGNSPQNGETYEFKVNCWGEYHKLEDCFLYDLDAVRIVGPDNKIYDLNKDFNVNSYSGEVTRRWVLYGEPNSKLPESGRYAFEFIKDNKTILTRTVDYVQSEISYPTNVSWKRMGNDLYVEWIPPEGVQKGMWYKVIIWNQPDTENLFISDTFDWDARSALMKNVPLLDGGNYSLNVAIFFSNGYAYSEYKIVTW